MGIPADIADGDQTGITTETDPTITDPSVKDGVSWDELSSVPSGFVDGIDNEGLTSESDPQVGSNSLNHVPKWSGSALVTGTIYDNGNIGIGTSSPETKLHVVGGAKFNIGSGSITFTTPGGWPGLIYYAPNGHRRDIQFYNDFTAITMSESSAASNNLNGIQIRENGHVGIGTSNPRGRLEVVSDDLTGALFTSNYASSSTKVLHAEYTGSGTYQAIAVYGKSKPLDYNGIGGKFEGGYAGIHSEVNGQSNKIYVGAQIYSTGGSGLNYGMYARANGSGTNYAVYGHGYGGTTNYAGYFAGNVYVTGTLEKPGGGFKIDHPLEPENKYLQHSFVESPDMMNIYNGNVVLDDLGEALVELPEWFESLNRNFRYQLTAIGAPGPNLYIAEEISGNSFRIAGGESGMKVSWQVTGIRKDPWADANRIAVEQEKPAVEQGYFLHPEAYGKSIEQGVEWARDPERVDRMKEELEKSQAPTS
jgi:hypothetical protein